MKRNTAQGDLKDQKPEKMYISADGEFIEGPQAMKVCMAESKIPYGDIMEGFSGILSSVFLPTSFSRFSPEQYEEALTEDWENYCSKCLDFPTYLLFLSY